MAKPSAPAPAAARKHAVAASRGAVLAVHASAGLAVQVSREAERLLRASEGLARAAVACLERANRNLDAATGDSNSSGPQRHVGASSPQPEMKMKNSNKRSKKKKKDMDLDVVEKDKMLGKVASNGDAFQPSGPAAPLCADAVAFGPAEAPIGWSDGLDDRWADGLTVSPTVPLSAAGDAAKRRTLKPRRSSTRSPRRGGSRSPPPSTTTPQSGHLAVGRIAVIRELESRPELCGQRTRLLELAQNGRWVCELQNGQRVRIVPEKLAGLPGGSQVLADVQFRESSVL